MMGNKITQIFQLLLALVFTALLIGILQFVSALKLEPQAGLRTEGSVLAAAEVGQDASIHMSGDSVISAVVLSAQIDENRAFMQKPEIYKNYKYKLGSVALSKDNVKDKVRAQSQYKGTFDLATYTVVFQEV